MEAASPVNATLLIVTVVGHCVLPDVKPNKVFGLFSVQFVKDGDNIQVLENMLSALELFKPTIFADASDGQLLNMLLVLIARLDGNVSEGTTLIDLLPEHHW